MGSSQSADGKRVTIEKENESFNVVLVSENVVRRLRGQPLTKSSSEPTNGPRVQELSAALHEQAVLSQRLQQDLAKSQHEASELRQNLRQAQTNLENAKKSMNAGAVSGAQFDNFRAVEKYWQEKQDEFNRKQEAILNDASKQFSSAVEQMQNKFFKNTCHTACAEIESQVLQCFLQNPRQPLKCAGISRAFTECVDKYRENLLQKQL